jgi:hypothetical protein
VCEATVIFVNFIVYNLLYVHIELVLYIYISYIGPITAYR